MEGTTLCESNIQQVILSNAIFVGQLSKLSYMNTHQIFGSSSLCSPPPRGGEMRFAMTENNLLDSPKEEEWSSATANFSPL
jgi:hypothetical protein